MINGVTLLKKMVTGTLKYEQEFIQQSRKGCIAALETTYSVKESVALLAWLENGESRRLMKV